jgi:hypothetical protein
VKSAGGDSHQKLVSPRLPPGLRSTSSQSVRKQARPVNVRLMLRVLKVIRFWRHVWRRRAEHEPPHWLNDLLDALDWVNLLPTALALLLVPEHFFRRTRELLRASSSSETRKLYKTPVKFLISAFPILVGFRALAIGGLYKLGVETLLLRIAQSFNFIAAHVSNKEKLFTLFLCDKAIVLEHSVRRIQRMPDEGLVAIVLAFVPLWVPAFSMLVFLLLAIPSSFGYVAPEGTSLFRVAFDLATYRRLKWRRFAWNLFYFDIYFLVMFPLATFGLIAAFHQPGWAVFKIPPLRLFVFCGQVAFLGGILVRPYNALLRSSVKAPTRLMQEIGVQRLRSLLEELNKLLNVRAKVGFGPIRSKLKEIASECEDLRLSHLRYAFRNGNTGPRWQTVIRRETGECYAALPTIGLTVAASELELGETERELALSSLGFIRRNRDGLDEYSARQPFLKRPLSGWQILLSIGIAALVAIAVIWLIVVFS